MHITSFIMFKPDDLEKVIKGTKTSTSRTHPVRNGIHKLDVKLELDVQCFHYNKFKEMKNPENWAKAEGFKSIADMKANTQYRHVREFIAGKKDIYIYTFKLIK